MADIMLKALDGGLAAIAESEIASLKGALRGALCLPGDPGYEEARTIWNATVDRRPAMVVRAAGAADVMHAVDFARTRKALLAVRGGGHNIAGNAVCDGGLMLDLSPMRSVRVDLKTKRAHVGPGATLGDVDKETQAFGLAVPVGVNSTTGIAGLTLGGGFGWITRKFGLTVDSLASVDIVTADGKLRHADAKENADLFWAVRGGGGNFGVVTSFEFELHDVGPQVLSGLIVHPLREAPKLLREFRKIVATAPDELTCWVVMRKAPPLPFIPAKWHGREVMVFALCYCGDAQSGEKSIAAIRALGAPIAEAIGPSPFVGWQTAFDPLLTPGARNYWKSHDFTTLSDEAVGAIVDAAGRLPSDECEVFIAHVGGAMSRIAADATAYPQRASHFIMNVHTRWRDPADDETCIAWARALFTATAPHATGSVYVNFMPDDEAERVAPAYGTNYRRLAEIKRRYDPGNLFRMNQNIAPATSDAAAAE
ncbi:MAG TPA: FAD-binding oxidoreductase [Alphaproteobacteria bacterium]|nr:FAD-binding oxidoreductase [Alphaproteobacteria bacterium]